MKRHPTRTMLQALSLGYILAVAHMSRAQSSIQDVDEFQVRAMMIFNLTKFIDWPPLRSENHAPFVLCMTENDELSSDLEAIVTNRTIRGNAVLFRRGVAPDQAATCHLLYVAHLKKGSVLDPAGTLAGAAVLTVSGDHISRSGSVIGLPMFDGRIQIEVDRGLAQRSHLILSSHLLQIANNRR